MHATKYKINKKKILAKTLKPLKRANKKIVTYVSDQPYKSITVATAAVVSSLLLGWAYLRYNNHRHHRRFF